MSKHSDACCRIPPVIVEGYEPKGTYVELNGIKTYVTGPENSDKALLSVYDIFGFFPQTIQGADILADGDVEKKYQVYMPDFFEGNPAKIEWYPPTDDEKKAKLGKWFEGAVWPKHLPKVPGILEAAKKHNPNISSWGIIGYCWGGKMASILAGDEEPLFKAAVQTSPAMIDPVDAANVKIPMMILASEEESAEDVKKYEEALKGPGHMEIFGDQLHGFMSARANLGEENAKSEYERGYKLALEFFREHL
ncbi:alpha/beta-hydrolase [Annulohypoxylon truncatum]|uniref:alpha/beta-hydrolase n=1 Tax=Annulohypoxylon truncatum TaxID=327061 RepID=UPI002007684C|nr:alpha/beta-hydrolase [Annulohypoxylon truncatum]KAI1213255.1 alpha/beta-hydrolase [Annulohypoxylon truncatum]